MEIIRDDIFIKPLLKSFHYEGFSVCSRGAKSRVPGSLSTFRAGQPSVSLLVVKILPINTEKIFSRAQFPDDRWKSV